MKIEPVMITSFKMADQNADFITKESCKSLSVFYKFQMDNKWSKCTELMRIFFLFKSQTRVIQRMSFCIALVICTIF